MSKGFWVYHEEHSEPVSDDYIHVIEYSAYEELLAIVKVTKQYIDSGSVLDADKLDDMIDNIGVING